MFFTAKNKHLTGDSREVNIADDCNLQQLHRLNTDFGFIVVARSESSSTPKKYTMCEVGLEGPATQANIEEVTPAFDSLSELESFVSENLIDILNNYLFGDMEEHQLPTAI